MIVVRFFASVRESLGIETTDLEGDGIRTVVDVIDALVAREGGAFRDVLTQEKPLIAVNQVMVKPDAPVRAGDEVAFFPPVTGG